MTRKRTAALNLAMCAAVESMLEDDTIEGLVGQLRAKYNSDPSEAADAVEQAVETLVTRPDSPSSPQGYLAACAYNNMNRAARRRLRQTSLDALTADDGEGEFGGAQFAADQLSVEDEVLRSELYDTLRRHVEKWETNNIRVVTLLHLEATFGGEPLTSADAASIAADILGYEVEPEVARQWKSRGFKRLRTYIETLDNQKEQPRD